MEERAATNHIRDGVSRDVRAFYEQMPFNYYATASDAAQSVCTNPLQAYPDLVDVFENGRVETVLEIGCGAGWAANATALHYGKQVTAVDMTQKALDRAQESAQHLGTADRTRFVHANLFDFQPGHSFDLVMSIGVLHHTFDCRLAFERISDFVAPGGFLFVGLYHLYGRRAFLRMFHEILAQEGEEAAFLRYRALNPGLRDQVHLRSWFRDQVLHPQETQHTLEEVLGWLDACNLTLVSTSINRYGDASDRAALIAAEPAFEALSQRRNGVENSFFPGFFTVLATRPAR